VTRKVTVRRVLVKKINMGEALLWKSAPDVSVRKKKKSLNHRDHRDTKKQPKGKKSESHNIHPWGEGTKIGSCTLETLTIRKGDPQSESEERKKLTKKVGLWAVEEERERRWWVGGKRKANSIRNEEVTFSAH